MGVRKVADTLLCNISGKIKDPIIAHVHNVAPRGCYNLQTCFVCVCVQ
jgi:hypothetical protein